MDARLVELHKNIDLAVLGRRLRIAREAAGLTQTQLASGDASTAYISRIESGQRRPDLHLLEQLAERVGSTTEELLDGITHDRRSELRLELDYAELSLASGDAAAALKGATAVLEGLPESDRSDLARSASYLRAFALEATGNLDAAIMALEDLIAEPTADTRWMRGLIGLSRCYRESGDLGMAVGVGDRAAEEIERLGLGGTTEAMQLTLTVAAAHFERGDTSHAIRLCKRTIARAEALDSITARGSAYWNASVMASRQGSLDEALALARRALDIFEQDSSMRNLALLRTELAHMQLRHDPHEAAEAKRTLERAAQEMDWSQSTPMDKADNQLVMARASLLLGDVDAAAEQARESLAIALDHSPLGAAEALVVQGEIAMSRGDVPAATASYRRAIMTLAGAGADRRVAELWFELGGLLEEVGDTEAALDAFRRSAASTGLTPRISSRPQVAGQATLTPAR